MNGYKAGAAPAAHGNAAGGKLFPRRPSPGAASRHEAAGSGPARGETFHNAPSPGEGKSNGPPTGGGLRRDKAGQSVPRRACGAAGTVALNAASRRGTFHNIPALGNESPGLASNAPAARYASAPGAGGPGGIPPGAAAPGADPRGVRPQSVRPRGVSQQSAAGGTACRRGLRREGFRRARKNVARGLFALAIAALGAAFLWDPARSAQAGMKGLELCARVMIPSLFPFFVLSSLTVELGLAGALGRAADRLSRPLFGASGGAPAFCIGLLGGYPSGARALAEMYDRGEISRQDAGRLLASCCNCGPAFILGVAGSGIFRSGRVGLLMYAVHIAAALVCALVFRGGGGDAVPARARNPGRPPSAAVGAAFSAAVSSGLSSTLTVCAYVVFFTLAAELAPLPEGLAGAALAGALEMSTGVSRLAGNLSREAAAVCAGLVGWGGLCVHAQAMSFIGGLPKGRYFLGKLLQGAVSVLLMWIFFPLAV